MALSCSTVGTQTRLICPMRVAVVLISPPGSGWSTKTKTSVATETHRLRMRFASALEVPLRPAGAGALGEMLVGPDHVHHGVDEREVGERLREVAEVAPGLGVDLLGVEAERAGVPEQPLAEQPRALQLADLAQRRHEPERADQERPLPALEAVV